MIARAPSSRQHDATRSGLTLIEIGMVMMILVTVSGLVLYGVFGARERSPLSSTELLLRSTIRQARQTAQSSGLPVELRFDAASRTISGVTNTLIIGENFETKPGQGQSLERPEARVASGSSIITPGYSGYGWSLGIRDSNAGGLKADRPLPLPLLAPRGRRIMAREGDGFTLSAFFKPSYLDDDRGATIRPVDIVSLVDTKERATTITLQLAVHRENGINAWYYPRCEVRSPNGRGQIEDNSLRLNGDSWYHLAVTYNGDEMLLFVNERRSDQGLEIPPFRFRGPPGVAVGSEPTGNRPVGIVDNVRLVAAGMGSQIQLPGNVRPDVDYHVTIDATSVRINGSDSSQADDRRAISNRTSTLRFRNNDSGAGPVLNAAITASGMVQVAWEEEGE